MKKIMNVMFLMVTLLVIISMSVSALSEIIQTDIGDITGLNTYYTPVYVDDENIYLFGYNAGFNFSVYNSTNNQISFLFKNTSLNVQSYQTECSYYESNDKIYCIGLDSNVNNPQVWSYDLLSQNVYVLLNSNNLSSLIINAQVTQCELRPNSDEIWCVVTDDGSPYSALAIPTYYKYDIGDNSFDYVFNYSSGCSAVWGDLSFRNQDEIWNSGGYCTNGSGVVTDEIIIYNLTTDSISLKSLPLAMESHKCKWVNGIYYCYAGEDTSDDIYNITYYNPITDAKGISGNLDVSFAQWGTCVDKDNLTDICLGGYFLPSWNFNEDIYQISFFDPEQLGYTELETTYYESYYPSQSDLGGSGCLHTDYYLDVDNKGYGGGVGTYGLFLWNLTDGNSAGYISYSGITQDNPDYWNDGICSYDSKDDLLVISFNGKLFSFDGLTDNNFKVVSPYNSSLYVSGLMSIGADNNYIYSKYQSYGGTSDLAYHNKTLSLLGVKDLTIELEEINNKMFVIRDNYLYTWTYKQVHPNFKVDVYEFSEDLIDDNLVYVGNFSFVAPFGTNTYDWLYQFDTMNHSTFYVKIGDNIEPASAGTNNVLIRLDLADNDAPSVDWESQQPSSLLTTNQENISFYFELDDDYYENSNVTCVLYDNIGQVDSGFFTINGVKSLDAINISEGNHYYIINCTDSLGLSDTTSTKMIETDYTTPFLAVLSPNIDNSTVFWKLLNITFFTSDTNLDLYLYRIFNSIPTLLYSIQDNLSQPNDTISHLLNTSTYDDGLYTFRIIINDSGTNYNEKVYEMTRCTPDWEVYSYSDCLLNDSKLALVYQDNNGCGLDYGYNEEVYEWAYCDYCTPHIECNDCDGRNCIGVADINDCYSLTSLESDLINITDYSLYDSGCEYQSAYSTEDADNIFIDMIGTIGVQIIKYIPIIIIFIFIIIGIVQGRKVFSKKN